MFSSPIGQHFKHVEITHVLDTNPQILFIWQDRSIDISDWGDVELLMTG